MRVGSLVWSTVGAVEAVEVKLSLEGLVLALVEIIWHYFIHEACFVTKLK